MLPMGSRALRTGKPDGTMNGRLGEEMATINDVARYAKVSKSTVSNVVGKRKYVSEEVTLRVLDACRRLNYVPSFTAQTLVTKETGIIGLFLGTEERYDAFYGDLIRGVVMQAREYGLKVLIYYGIGPQEMSDSLRMHKEPIDGAILIQPLVNDFRIERIAKDELPYVLIGKPERKRDILRVDVDNAAIAHALTERLIGMGSRRFIYFTTGLEFTIAEDRMKGFREAIDEAGISRRGNVKIRATDHFGEEAVEYLEGYLTGRKKNFLRNTAILVPSDIIGRNVYGLLNRLGYEVGRDVSVVALGGMECAARLKPALTTVDVSYETIGRHSVHLLYERIQGKGASPETVFVDADIIYTDSCALFSDFV